MGFFKTKNTSETNIKQGVFTPNTEANVNDICELVFILDRRGSMAGLEADTIGGFNSMIDKQKKQDGRCYVTTVLFDDKIDTVHDRAEISEISPMTDKQYFVRGSTALLDAVGSTIEHISEIHKYIRREDVPSKTLFVITTDGMENASRRFTAEKVKKMISLKKKENWDFLFLGANIDAVSAANDIGISEDRAVRFNNDSEGIAENYKAVANFACEMRACPSPSCNIDSSWKKDIEEDYRRRGKK